MRFEPSATRIPFRFSYPNNSRNAKTTGFAGCDSSIYDQATWSHFIVICGNFKEIVQPCHSNNGAGTAVQGKPFETATRDTLSSQKILELAFSEGARSQPKRTSWFLISLRILLIVKTSLVRSVLKRLTDREP